jgi:hypothetical protein
MMNFNIKNLYYFKIIIYQIFKDLVMSALRVFSHHKTLYHLSIFIFLFATLPAYVQQWQALEYDSAKAPVDNPLKGFMPYVGEYDFPYSLEYFYIGMAEIVIGPGQYNWQQKLEPTLNEIANRGHQAVFRIYLEYPRRPLQVPQFILDTGIKITPYETFGGGQSPDFDNPLLVKTMVELINELGHRYDSDPRIGFIEVGLLGHWGEFHSWPQTELFASAETQNKVLDAYEAAFKTTGLLVSQDIFAHTPMARIKDRRIGLHDDVFTRATLDKKQDHFYARVVRYGKTDHWKTTPVGGEITPRQQSCIWDIPSCVPDDYYQCVKSLHASWLLNQGAFKNEWLADKVQRAIQGSRALGYEFYVSAYRIKEQADVLKLDIQVKNTGVAPFYYNWPCQVVLLGRGEVPAVLIKPDWDIRIILPSDTPSEFSCMIPYDQIEAGIYRIALQIPNPLPNGSAVKMANVTQQENWLILGRWEKK